MPRSLSRVTGLILLVPFVCTVPANAQENGGVYDPDSPAGVEYALPLDHARRGAAGADAPGDDSVDPDGVRRAAPSFGIGVRSGKAGKPSSGSRRGDSDGDGTAEASPPVIPSATWSSSLSLRVTAIIVLAVLGFAALVALATRRRRAS